MGHLWRRSGCTNTFNQLDQQAYPQGTWLANMYGQTYGFAVVGPECSVTRTDNISISDSTRRQITVGGEPPAAAEATVDHIAAIIATTIAYCIPPTNNSLVTSVRSASGAISTLDTINPEVEHDLDVVIEVFNYNNSYYNASDTLPPFTCEGTIGQGPYYQTRQQTYPNLWIPPNALTTSICNTLTLIRAAGGDVVAPQGCIQLNLPNPVHGR